MRLQRHVANTEEKRDTQNVLMGKSKGKRLFGRVRHKIEGNIRMYTKGIGSVDMDWIHRA